MHNYGVILKKLRSLSQLTIKEAAKKIEKSSGWLSEVENDRGRAKVHPDEFERIVKAYGGEAYRKQFGMWVTKAQQAEASPLGDVCFGGAVLKHLRKKANMNLRGAAEQTGISVAYLSYVESGKKALSPALRDKLMKIYGYSPSSFKNFASEDKRAKNIPVQYKLAMLLKKLDQAKVEKIFKFALETSQSPITTSHLILEESL